MRHMRHKPLGYAGDYQAIDWLYTRRVDFGSPGEPWDVFTQRQPSAVAVRNRLAYLRDLIVGMCRERGRGVSVLDLACGPCRDVAEAVEAAGEFGRGSHFHCVDVEPRALEHGRRVFGTAPAWATVQFEAKNALRVRPGRRYDLVWSGGLFDYLSEKRAAALVRRMWSLTETGGRMVVGNFHPANPSRLCMEWCLDWHLIHRSDEDLARLADLAVVPSEAVTVEREALGVCAFLVARKD